jgi:hypothetical protein
MLYRVLELLFRCRHKNITRPVAPVRKRGVPQGDSYVVCLDCGQQFAYNAREWLIGKPLPPQASTHQQARTGPAAG